MKEYLSDPAWVNVLITAIYVIATIFILFANWKSAKAAKAQLEETKKQFELTGRLQCMPYLQMEVALAHAVQHVTIVQLCSSNFIERFAFFKLRNLGNGTAVNIIFEWECNKEKIVSCQPAPFNAIKSGDEYCWCFNFLVTDPEYKQFKPILLLQYEDMLGNIYSQKFMINFSDELSATDGICIDVWSPVYLGKS